MCDDNESEMILGVNWDKSESRGVKWVHLGHTRYHREGNRVLGCKKVVENDYQNQLALGLLV